MTYWKQLEPGTRSQKEHTEQSICAVSFTLATGVIYTRKVCAYLSPRMCRWPASKQHSTLSLAQPSFLPPSPTTCRDIIVSHHFHPCIQAYDVYLYE
mmetsp:Transcript_37751/g.60901  ORF Transcript_37751/g.60901 Transcript_37751/m.60901 type:complete len:97 (-) Transcript_37751:200-490(-)